MSYLAKTPEDLLPCPFCGGEARIIAKPYEPKVCVGCDDDTCLGFSGLGWLYDSDKEATEAWNRRAERTCQIVVSVDRSPASYGGRVHRCSSCGKALPGALFRNGWTQLDYCPRCGARVTEVVRDDD